MAAAKINRERAASGLMTVTELADTLVRREAIRFPAAHQLAARAVDAPGEERTPARLVAELGRLAPERIGRPLRFSEKEWPEALDPEYFVRVRHVPSGPAPQEVRRQIERARPESQAARAWLDEKLALLARYPELLRQAARERGVAGL